jgi:hypothetical protein
MKKHHYLMVLGLTAGLYGIAAQAGTCALSITRTACPGNEEISYKKCDGKASCVENQEAASLDACKAAATEACANARTLITKSKVITATFDGAAVDAGADVCLGYANRATEFDKCE